MISSRCSHRQCSRSCSLERLSIGHPPWISSPFLSSSSLTPAVLPLLLRLLRKATTTTKTKTKTIAWPCVQDLHFRRRCCCRCRCGYRDCFFHCQRCHPVNHPTRRNLRSRWTCLPSCYCHFHRRCCCCCCCCRVSCFVLLFPPLLLLLPSAAAAVRSHAVA